MGYWRDDMNWPIVRGWVCETCEHETHPDNPRLILWPELTWGLINGECRCNICHTQYMMRDENGRVIIPICQLKPEYKKPAHYAWMAWNIKVDEMPDKLWDQAIETCKEK